MLFGKPREGRVSTQIASARGQTLDHRSKHVEQKTLTRSDGEVLLTEPADI